MVANSVRFAHRMAPRAGLEENGTISKIIAREGGGTHFRGFVDGTFSETLLGILPNTGYS